VVCSSSNAPGAARQTFTGRFDPVGFSILQIIAFGSVDSPAMVTGMGADEYDWLAQPLIANVRKTAINRLIVCPLTR
jgi:hypothetical protein